MTVFELTSVVGLFVGPIASAVIAVWMTDRSHKRELRSERKLEIFRTLMRTRRAQLDPSFVGALNLVEVDFHDDENVKAKFRDLFSSYSNMLPRLPSEMNNPSDNENSTTEKDRQYGDRVYNDRQEKVVRLLHSIGTNIGYNIEQLDVLKGGYHPQKFLDIEREQEIVRKLLLDIALGHRGVPISVMSEAHVNQQLEKH